MNTRSPKSRARRIRTMMTTAADTVLRAIVARHVPVAIPLLMLALVPARAQHRYVYDSTFFGPFVGVHATGPDSLTRAWGEIGITRMQYSPSHSGPELTSLSASIQFSPNDTPMVAVTASGLYHVLFFGLGLTAGYFFDRYRGELRVIPEFYLGSDRFAIGGGPQIVLMKSRFLSVPEGMLSLRWSFPMWSVPRKR